MSTRMMVDFSHEPQHQERGDGPARPRACGRAGRHDDGGDHRGGPGAPGARRHTERAIDGVDWQKVLALAAEMRERMGEEYLSQDFDELLYDEMGLPK